jgi:hypothetical protein
MRRLGFPKALDLLRDDEFEVHDAQGLCVRRIVGPTSKPSVIRVSDASGADVVTVLEEVAPWSGKPSPCLVVDGSVAGALEYARLTRKEHLGSHVFGREGQSVVEVRKHVSRRAGVFGWGSARYEIEPHASDALLDEPFASAVIVAVLTMAYEKSGI